MKVWDAETGQELLTLKEHTGGVSSVAVTSDGKRIVSGSNDQTVKVWDASKGQEEHTLNGHTSWVNSVAVSSDGERIVSGSNDQTVKVWDAETGQELLTLKGDMGVVYSVAVSPDGKRIVSGSEILRDPKANGEVKVWDAETGQELLTLKDDMGVYSVAVSPDGKRIVSGGGKPFTVGGKLLPGEVKVWDAETGQELLTLKEHTGVVRSVAVSPDGKRIVSGSGGWSVPTKRLPCEVKVWDAETGQELLTLKGHMANVTSVAVSPDGKRIVSGVLEGR